MASGRTIPFSGLKRFIQQTLKEELREDLQQLLILKEADIETRAYYHLRRYLKPDPAWKVFARYSAKQIHRYIDLVVFRGRNLMVAIELKWNRKKISEKDRGTLGAALEKLHARRAYAITLLRDKREYTKSKKRKAEKYKLHEIRVGLDWSPNRVAAWNARRREFR